jgi:hypothetical protein
MTDQTSSTLQDFDAKKYFTKARRHFIEEPLKMFGFRKYKTSVIARLTTENVFQFLDFQKSAYGGQNFTVNVALRPLFSRNDEYLTLLPGNRLGLMATKSKGDKWWNYTTKIEGDTSFENLFDKIEKYALPFFNSTQNSKDIITSYEKNFLGINKFGDRVAWGTIGWEDFDLGHIYLHAGQIKKAVKHFDACYKEFSRDDREWAQAAAAKCLEVNQIIELGQSQIDKYLTDTIKDSKEKLKLTDW